jgi:ATP-dependent Clp protease adaptor protein ClpS
MSPNLWHNLQLLNVPRPFGCAIGIGESLIPRRQPSNYGPPASAPAAPFGIEEEETDVLTEYDTPFNLVVWNDEVNTFEWVIETLMEVIGHSLEQAEQCAMIIHTQGKYAVKRGSYDELKPYCDAITDRGIGATIEIMSGT